MNIEKIISGTPAAQNNKKTTETSGGSSFSDVLSSIIGSSCTDLEGLFEEASKRYGVSLDLLKAVAKTESNFNPSATSSCGAMGIMQLMPGTAAGLGVTDAYDPEQNIMAGAKMLRNLLNKYGGQTELALAAYNAGSGNVEKYGGIPPFAETQKYVSIIMNSLNGASGYTIPEKYNNYKEHTSTKVSNDSRLLSQYSNGNAEQDIDPQYLLAILQLNMQMDLFGNDKDDNKII